mmetsp:Transcript_62571/g.129815  ORF Transcript_62571/g.129815 Transcript_62571/m.129815 type:complete len:89 (-) Transcript_62571:317-583(-)
MNMKLELLARPRKCRLRSSVITRNARVNAHAHAIKKSKKTNIDVNSTMQAGRGSPSFPPAIFDSVMGIIKSPETKAHAIVPIPRHLMH